LLVLADRLANSNNDNVVASKTAWTVASSQANRRMEQKAFVTGPEYCQGLNSDMGHETPGQCLQATIYIRKMKI
jgi:hypothetical protein